MKNLIPVFALLVIVSCNLSTRDSAKRQQSDRFSAQVEKPVDDIHIPAIEVTFDASKEKSFVSSKGSRVTIPPNAFMNEDGKPVQGEVTIVFTEFHSAAEILLSGIPMSVTSEEGELHDFESAGMFEIQGSAEGKPIHIREGKQVQIDLASPVESEDYDFYAYSNRSNSWELLYEKTPAQPNSIKKAIKEQGESQIMPSRPIEVKKASSNDVVFELAVDLVKNPEFKALNSVLWRSSGKSKYDESLFDSEIVNPNLTCIDQQRSVFQLEGLSRGETISMQVEPVLFGSSFKKAQMQFQNQLVAYQQAKQEKEKREAAEAMMMDFQRTLTVSNFGLYNCDRYRRLSPKVKRRTIAAIIPGIVAASSKIFLVVKNGVNSLNQRDIVVPYASVNSEVQITYNLSETNHLIYVDPSGMIYEHRNLNQTDLPVQFSKGNATPVHFTSTGVRISDVNTLDQYLNELP